MKRSVPLASLLFAAVSFTACSDQALEPSYESSSTQSALALSAVAGDVQLTRGPLIVPAGTMITDQQLVDLTARAINPADYVCTTTNISDWWLDEVLTFLAAETPLFILLYQQLLADLVPTYWALYFETSESPQSYGYQGEYTRILEKTDREARRFWDIPSSHIQLVAMKGDMLLDVEKVAQVYNFVWGLPMATANLYATLVRDAVLQSQYLNGGHHALFSFNAFAFNGHQGLGVPAKIAMGDAIMAGYAALGFADVAPQAIYAHEFAHHIQFAGNYFNDEFSSGWPAPERTRYTELMADAMAAYFMTHKRGLTMNRKRVEQFLQVFFEIGDCQYTNSGHHGTPNQRMRAAEFGFNLADQTKVKGKMMTAEEFYQLFLAEYPRLIAPDAT